MTIDEFWDVAQRVFDRGFLIASLADGLPVSEEVKREHVADFLSDMGALASEWFNPKGDSSGN